MDGAATRLSAQPVAADGDGVFSAFPRWHFWDDRAGGDPEARLARDVALGEAMARADSLPTFRLWQNRRALVVSRRESRLQRFEAASLRLAQEGWPVLVRDSGGGAVPHGEGILHLSLVLPRSDAPAFSIEALYRALCKPLRIALGGLGIETDLGAVPGAFCDGRFNLIHRGRKLAGTAQRWRGGPAGAGAIGGYVLAHALLVVDHDLAAANAALNRFYALARSDRRVDPHASTTVRACLSAGERPVGLPPVDLPPGKRLTDTVRAGVAAATKLLLEGREEGSDRVDTSTVPRTWPDRGSW